MTDHPTLVAIWTKLREKRNVIAFVDTTNSEEDIKPMLDWFEPITECSLSQGEIQLQNGTFLIFRQITNTMPVLDPRVVGDYEVIVINNETCAQIVQGLKE
jgi:hypothetical protein